MLVRTIMLVLMLAAPAVAGEFTVGNGKQLADAIKKHKPGDVIIMADGEWRDVDIKFYANGTAEQPVTLRAQTPGKVILSGASKLRIGGQWGVVDGLLFTDGAVSGHVIQFRGPNDAGATNCRLTNTAIVNYNPADGAKSFWVSLYGKNNRVDHCRFDGKNNEGPTLVVWVEQEPNDHRIDHNHFVNRPPLGRNGGETIRVGTSEVSLNVSRTIVENNLFTACDGESEIISNKSCENVYRSNTFIESMGGLTLRHGNRCRVEGNIFLGNNKPGTGGIRIIGEDHEIVGNYLEGLAGENFESAMPIVNGIPNSKPNEYFRVQRARIEGNIFVNCRQSLTFGVGAGARNRIEPPMNVAVVNNIIVSEHGPLIRYQDQPIGTRFEGNIAWGAELGTEPVEGIRLADPKLQRDENGLLRPSQEAAGVTANLPSARPLAPGDVGPAWMDRPSQEARAQQ